MFDYFKKRAITTRADDELLYEYVLKELESGQKSKGLWAKAYANSDGNNAKIEPLYLQYRVQAIKDAFSMLEITYKEYTREKLFDYISNYLFKEVAKKNDQPIHSEKTQDIQENTENKKDAHISQISNQNTDGDILVAFGFIGGLFLIIFIGSWIYHLISK